MTRFQATSSQCCRTSSTCSRTMAINSSQDDILKLHRRWFQRLARLALTHAWMRWGALPHLGMSAGCVPVLDNSAGLLVNPARRMSVLAGRRSNSPALATVSSGCHGVLTPMPPAADYAARLVWAPVRRAKAQADAGPGSPNALPATWRAQRIRATAVSG
jgi:hypothetical protein